MPNSVLSGGGGVNSVSTLSTEENTMVMSSEDSSSYPDESELELSLGLSLGVGGEAKPPAAAAARPGSWDQYARILTAKDFPSMVSTEASSSSSSSSSPVTKTNNNNGSKRIAEPSSPPGRSAVSSQIAGWPPIGTYRMNSLVNHAKSPATGENASTIDKYMVANIVVDKTNYSHGKSNTVANEGRLPKKSFFVKVTMDGISIGRKVDLNAHSCYEALAHTLDHMFTLSAAVGQRQLNVEEQVVVAGRGRPAISLDGSSDFVLTYEDKEGDWMLVGDVPWEVFMSSARRLRIRRTSDANGRGLHT